MTDDIDMRVMSEAQVIAATVAGALGLPSGEYEIAVDDKGADRSLILTGRNECGELELLIRSGPRRPSIMWNYTPTEHGSDMLTDVESCAALKDNGFGTTPECEQLERDVGTCVAKRPDDKDLLRVASALRVFELRDKTGDDISWIERLRDEIAACSSG